MPSSWREERQRRGNPECGGQHKRSGHGAAGKKDRLVAQAIAVGPRGKRRAQGGHGTETLQQASLDNRERIMAARIEQGRDGPDSDDGHATGD